MKENFEIVDKRSISDLIDELTLIKVEIVDKLESNEIKNIVGNFKEIESFKTTYIKQIDQLQKNYESLENKLSKSNSLNITRELENLKQELLKSLKNIDWNAVKTKHDETVANALVVHLANDYNYSSMLKEITNFNKENAITLRENAKDLTGEMKKLKDEMATTESNIKKINWAEDRLVNHFYKALNFKQGVFTFLSGMLIATLIILFFLPKIAEVYNVDNFYKYEDVHGKYGIVSTSSTQRLGDQKGTIKIYKGEE